MKQVFAAVHESVPGPTLPTWAVHFADQSHFTRVFTQLAGISPGAWRRSLDQ